TDNYTTAYVVAKAKNNRKFARYIVELAAFDFEVCHRPGKENIVADTLSRNPLSCFTVIASALEIIDAQLRDPFCAVMKTKLNQPPTTNHLKQIHATYYIEDGVLLRTSPPLLETIVTVVPASLTTQVIRTAHDEHAHTDVPKTLERIRREYWWPKMSRDVTLYVRSCEPCQRIN